MRATALRSTASALLLLTAAAFAGCASGSPPQSSGPAIPAPAAGTAWQVVDNGGGGKFGETSPDSTPWITVGPDGGVNARIPPSAQTRAAAPSLQPGSLGVLTIRRAP